MRNGLQKPLWGQKLFSMIKNRVVILTICDDISTDNVIGWLNYFSIAWKRINAEDFFEKSVSIKIKSKNLDKPMSEIVWFRKWLKSYSPNQSKNKEGMGKEFVSYSNFLFNKFFNDNYNASFKLNQPKDTNIDKLTQLKEASDLNLLIPQTIFTSQKSELLKFVSVNKTIITKTLAATLFIQAEQSYFMNYTRDFNISEINHLPNQFYPTLFQKKVIKKFDIRSFYLDGEFFSMAIFSQFDNQTKTDFRQYNYTNPNRTVPYQLPKIIENQLRSLMLKLELNSGSLDIVFDENQDYVFLEVNPVGQYDMVSNPCNYYLDKKIAFLFKEKLEHNIKN